ncbi:hypothetical protein CS542_06490 [Pedobacter sp. IW39]|nr:hypothetical protein CS542_06490 [Pedobacter sp. IW39]
MFSMMWISTGQATGQQKLSEAKNNIPQGIGNPEISPISTGLGNLSICIHTKPGFEKTYDARIKSIQDWIVRRQL